AIDRVVLDRAEREQSVVTLLAPGAERALDPADAVAAPAAAADLGVLRGAQVGVEREGGLAEAQIERTDVGQVEEDVLEVRPELTCAGPVVLRATEHASLALGRRACAHHRHQPDHTELAENLHGGNPLVREVLWPRRLPGRESAGAAHRVRGSPRT